MFAPLPVRMADCPLHTVVDVAVTVGRAFTVIENVVGLTVVHPASSDVALNTATPVLKGVNEPTLPIPEAFKPIPVLLFVQLMGEPAGLTTKLGTFNNLLIQAVEIFDMALITGVGFTVTVTSCKLPLQAPAIEMGVTE